MFLARVRPTRPGGRRRGAILPNRFGPAPRIPRGLPESLPAVTKPAVVRIALFLDEVVAAPDDQMPPPIGPFNGPACEDRRAARRSVRPLPVWHVPREEAVRLDGDPGPGRGLVGHDDSWSARPAVGDRSIRIELAAMMDNVPLIRRSDVGEERDATHDARVKDL